MSLFRVLSRLCVSAHLKNIKLWAFWSQEERRGHVTHVQLLTQTHKEAAKLWCAVRTGQKTLVGWCVDKMYETLAITDNVLETNVWTGNKVLNDQFPSYPKGLQASYLRTPRAQSGPVQPNLTHMSGISTFLSILSTYYDVTLHLPPI